MENKELEYIPGAGLLANIEYLKKKSIEAQKARGYQFTEDGAWIMNEHNINLRFKEFLKDERNKKDI